MEKLIQFHNSNTIKAAICHKPQLWSTTMMFLLMITLLLAVAVLSSGEETTQQRSLRIKEEKELEAFTWGGGVPVPPVPGPRPNTLSCPAGYRAVANNVALTAEVQQRVQPGRTFRGIIATCSLSSLGVVETTIVLVIVQLPGSNICTVDQARFSAGRFLSFGSTNVRVACPLLWTCITCIPSLKECVCRL